MLAKQVWRMINNPNSLCHRVFKARFFPNSSILKAKDSNTGSYSWKSIISARDVIRKGMVWRIGNGQNVRIEEDKWLLGNSNCPIISYLPTVATESKVQVLINTDLGVWKLDLVNQLFLPQEAFAILGIPLSRRSPPNNISCAYSPLGVFNISNDYKLFASGDAERQAESSNRDAQKQFWKGVWRLRVLNKIKHFIWRACNDALPMMSNIFWRQITSSNKCELCQLYPKDPLHAIWSCREVETTWSLFQCFHHTSSPQPLSFSDLLSRFLQVQEDYRNEVFTIAAWLLWNWRNAIHFGRSVHPTAHILSLAGNLLQDFLAAQQMDPILPRSITTQQWCPPELNYHKVNFDVAIFRDSKLAGIGVVVRDWRGEFVGALSSSMLLSHAVADMEAFACRKAVKFAIEIGL